MQHNHVHHLIRPLWMRLGAGLGCLAVLAALLMPVARLAQEVGSGKLGGLCGVSSSLNVGMNTGNAGNANLDSSHPDDSNNTTHTGSHCPMCGSAVFALPASFTLVFSALAVSQNVRGIWSTAFPAPATQLPPSCGPPLQTTSLVS